MSIRGKARPLYLPVGMLSACFFMGCASSSTSVPVPREYLDNGTLVEHRVAGAGRGVRASNSRHRGLLYDHRRIGCSQPACTCTTSFPAGSPLDLGLETDYKTCACAKRLRDNDVLLLTH